MNRICTTSKAQLAAGRAAGSRQRAWVETTSPKQVAPETVICHTTSKKYCCQVACLLGVGATSSVYSGLHTNTYQGCAIKVFNERMTPRELKITRTLKHENVVKYQDKDSIVWEEDPETEKVVRDVLILERCRGSLEDLLGSVGNHHGLSADSLMHLTADIGQVLAYFVRQQLIHRDIKPGNILYTLNHDRHFFKVTDFGAAKYAGQISDECRSLIGTQYYMHPSMLKKFIEGDKNSSVGYEVDKWSAAITLYQACTGQLPFVDSVQISQNMDGLKALYNIICQRPVHAISQRNGFWSTTLPSRTYLSRPLQWILENLLQDLMSPERDSDVLARMCQVKSLKQLLVFHMEEGRLIQLHVSPDITCEEIRTTLSAETGIHSENQFLFTDNYNDRELSAINMKDLIKSLDASEKIIYMADRTRVDREKKRTKIIFNDIAAELCQKDMNQAKILTMDSANIISRCHQNAVYMLNGNEAARNHSLSLNTFPDDSKIQSLARRIKSSCLHGDGLRKEILQEAENIEQIYSSLLTNNAKTICRSKWEEIKRNFLKLESVRHHAEKTFNDIIRYNLSSRAAPVVVPDQSFYGREPCNEDQILDDVSDDGSLDEEIENMQDLGNYIASAQPSTNSRKRHVEPREGTSVPEELTKCPRLTVDEDTPVLPMSVDNSRKCKPVETYTIDFNCDLAVLNANFENSFHGIRSVKIINFEKGLSYPKLEFFQKMNSAESLLRINIAGKVDNSMVALLQAALCKPDSKTMDHGKEFTFECTFDEECYDSFIDVFSRSKKVKKLRVVEAQMNPPHHNFIPNVNDKFIHSLCFQCCTSNEFEDICEYLILSNLQYLEKIDLYGAKDSEIHANGLKSNTKSLNIFQMMDKVKDISFKYVGLSNVCSAFANIEGIRMLSLIECRLQKIDIVEIAYSLKNSSGSKINIVEPDILHDEISEIFKASNVTCELTGDEIMNDRVNTFEVGYTYVNGIGVCPKPPIDADIPDISITLIESSNDFRKSIGVSEISADSVVPSFEEMSLKSSDMIDICGSIYSLPDLLQHKTGQSFDMLSGSYYSDSLSCRNKGAEAEPNVINLDVNVNISQQRLLQTKPIYPPTNRL